MDPNDFPPLSSATTSATATTGRAETRCMALQRQLTTLEQLVNQLVERQVLTYQLLMDVVKSDLNIVASEVLKWSIGKKSEEDGDGKQFYHQDPHVQYCVVRGSLAFNMQSNMHDYLALSGRCILARNAAAHMSSLAQLEEGVEKCKKALAKFPQLRESHPDQCLVIDNFPRLKTFLPHEFRD